MNYLNIKTPAQGQATDLASAFGIENQGFQHLDRIYWNLPESALYEEAIFRREGRLVHGGALQVDTSPHTARAAADKFVVREEGSQDHIWWGDYNRPFSQEKFNGLMDRLRAFLQGREVFVQDCFAGADPDYRMPIRVITEKAWHSLFARNMFLTTNDPDELRNHVPQFTVISLPSFKADPRIDGTRTETAIIINFAQRLAIICNSLYGGEIKKSIFTVLNYFLPLEGVLSMHCSANVGADDDVAIFFGLSGTGKTTLSADPERALIGDDEHGWSGQGVFNFEAGCYAKVIRLSAENEPEIYACTERYGTILENVIFDPASRTVDLNDDRITENTRASYPLDFIPHAVESKMSRSHPKNILFLTCDASGVLPPLSRLSPDQAMYHFISGYTSKIAGTEIGLGTEPKMTFSACFGAPFMVHHPFEYARLLKDQMLNHQVSCWLVNTGWTGGPFGVGKRISIRHTRQLLHAVLEGHLDAVNYRLDPLFSFEVPESCPGVPVELLNPEKAWGNPDEYWRKYDELAARYIENFKLFEAECPQEVKQAGPKRLRR